MESGNCHHASLPWSPGTPGGALRSDFSPTLALVFCGRGVMDRGLIWRFLKVRAAAWQSGQSPGPAWKLETTEACVPVGGSHLCFATCEIRGLHSQGSLGSFLKNSSTLFPAPYSSPQPNGPFGQSPGYSFPWETKSLQRAKKDVSWTFDFHRKLDASL